MIGNSTSNHESACGRDYPPADAEAGAREPSDEEKHASGPAPNVCTKKKDASGAPSGSLAKKKDAGGTAIGCFPGR